MVLQEANIPKGTKFLSLGDSLRVYLVALRIVNDPQYAQIGDNWVAELAQIRNMVAHGAVDLDQWPTSLEVVIKHWARIHKLVVAIEQVTEASFVGSYWDTEAIIPRE
jgi:hypothetical protein